MALTPPNEVTFSEVETPLSESDFSFKAKVQLKNFEKPIFADRNFPKLSVLVPPVPPPGGTTTPDGTITITLTDAGEDVDMKGSTIWITLPGEAKKVAWDGSAIPPDGKYALGDFENGLQTGFDGPLSGIVWDEVNEVWILVLDPEGMNEGTVAVEAAVQDFALGQWSSW